MKNMYTAGTSQYNLQGKVFLFMVKVNLYLQKETRKEYKMIEHIQDFAFHCNLFKSN